LGDIGNVPQEEYLGKTKFWGQRFWGQRMCQANKVTTKLSRCQANIMTTKLFSRVFKVFKVFHGFPWVSKVFKDFQGFSRYFKGFHGLSRFFMVFQDFQCFENSYNTLNIFIKRVKEVTLANFEENFHSKC
jgi:hypothetical protein